MGIDDQDDTLDRPCQQEAIGAFLQRTSVNDNEVERQSQLGQQFLE
jgi:hypothetical protein